MLEEFTTWLLGLIKEAFSALWDFMSDVFVGLIDMLLTALVALFGTIPIPAFLSEGLGSVWSGMDGGAMYLLTALGVPQGLAIIGAGYAFRLVRKVVTLFQW